MYIYIPDDFKPSKALFYLLSGITIVGGLALFFVSEGSDKKFGLFVAGSGFIFLLVGIFIVINNKLRNVVFGYNICPKCKKRSIDAKNKLKASWFKRSSHCKCPRCGLRLRLTIWALPIFLVFMFSCFQGYLSLSLLVCFTRVFWYGFFCNGCSYLFSSTFMYV